MFKPKLVQVLSVIVAFRALVLAGGSGSIYRLVSFAMQKILSNCGNYYLIALVARLKDTIYLDDCLHFRQVFGIAVS